MGKMRIDVPEYVIQQLKRKNFEEGGTQPYYVLKGLAANYC
jgi:cobalamin biosynthesis Co2+ chelatase CbiK